ncbi:MAG: hypothetical protein WKG07_13505 [Hymenobacter sp.]
MASNLDYLDPNLQPLVRKVDAYLAAKEDLRKLTIADRNEPTHDAAVAQSAQEFEQRPPTGSFDQYADELSQRRQDAQADLDLLAQEILALLPTRDEWVKVNLGYGPSRVGAWRVPNAQDPKAEHYEIRVVLSSSMSRVPVVAQLGPVVGGLGVGEGNGADALEVLDAVLEGRDEA